MDWKYNENQISCVDDKGAIISKVDFVKINNNEIDIVHVYVSPEYRGKGVADQTMLNVVDYLKNQGLRASASCSYANGWFTKNTEKYSDVISAAIKNQTVSCRIDSNQQN